VYGAKIKTPLQFVVSALRETGAVSFDARDLRALQELGMPLYQCQPPTGYADNAGTWLNAGALVSRVNIATRIAAGNQTLTLALGSPEFQRR
jgi:uncharacterized protein (DUF1800 family)